MKPIFMAVLGLMLTFSFFSCQDEETETSKFLVGNWVEDYYNDALVIKADGTGVWSEQFDDDNPLYFSWSYSNGVLVITTFGEDSDDTVTAIMVKQSDNKIFWKHYVDNPKAYSPNIIQQDECGYYYAWTWARYTK